MVAYGPISVTATGTGDHAFYVHGTGVKLQSASDITISATQGNWGLTMYDNSLIQSTGGNISITTSGSSGGMWDSTTGGIVASNNTASPTSATPTSGGGLTLNATGAGDKGAYVVTGSLISYGPMLLTTRSTAAAEGLYVAGSGVFRSVGAMTIDASTTGAATGFVLENSRVMQSTAGNISVTGVGNVGAYMNGSIVASNDTTNPTTATPTSGGSLTINATGSSSYGAIIYNGSLISYGPMSLTSRGTGAYQGLYVAGTGAFKSVGALTIDSATTGAQWGVDLESSRVIQSTAGNVSVTGVGDYGIYMNGSIVASNDTTNPTTATPTSGGTLTLNATGRTNYGLKLAAGSLVSNGAMSLTGTGLYPGLYIYGTGGVKSNGNITLNGTATPITLRLNWSGTAATIDASSTIDVTGTITVAGVMLGDD